MIALYLLAAHMVGDYLLQTRWQAVEKFTDPLARARHVAAYTACFAPVAFVYAPPLWAVVFLALLAQLHFLTDAQRFLRTPGEVISWRLNRDPRALAPNPWPAMPMMIDQTLHVLQIAVLAGIFLA